MFQYYDVGESGGKVKDFVQHAPLLASLGLVVPSGSVIQTEMFYKTMEEVGITEQHDAKSWVGKICPAELNKLCRHILHADMKVGIPYAIRSSALSERGGTGIYHTDFFVKKGNEEEDARALWLAIRSVYASEFTMSAFDWRKKTSGRFGMAVLIQEVYGFQFGNYFLPALSGVAYTSHEGLPLVRVVAGLGTAAVQGEGLLLHEPLENSIQLVNAMIEIPKAEVIDLSTGKIGHVDIRFPEINEQIARCPLAELFLKLAELKKHGSFSLEWAMTAEGIRILQCAPHEDKPSGDPTVDTEKHFLLLKSDDVFASGRVECRGVVYVNYWSAASRLELLQNLNETMKGYLLIVPEDALSSYAEGDACRIGFADFSNAAAVVENQRDLAPLVAVQLHMAGKSFNPHKGKGATHFQQLCDRTDILFVGGEVPSPLLFKNGPSVEYLGCQIAVWNIGAIVTVDSQNKQGCVYVEKMK